jgi:hypothetical protein
MRDTNWDYLDGMFCISGCMEGTSQALHLNRDLVGILSNSERDRGWGNLKGCYRKDSMLEIGLGKLSMGHCKESLVLIHL